MFSVFFRWKLDWELMSMLLEIILFNLLVNVILEMIGSLEFDDNKSVRYKFYF